jgi:hypothetical protein
MEEELKAIAERQRMDGELVKEFLRDSVSLKKDLLVRKALDFVLANAKIE